jgi:hypothetical protein
MVTWQAMSPQLDAHHRDTLLQLFTEPPSRNLEWRRVVSLLQAVGTVTTEKNGKVLVTLGQEPSVLHPPHDKDVEVQTIVDLRRMLRNAGYEPG